jgi:histidinol-phosphate aminotransferase
MDDVTNLPQPQPGIMDISPYQGGESGLAGVARVMKMSSNEGPLGPSPRAQAAFAAEAARLHRYPDGGCTALREAIGARWGLDPARIVCGAGSDELIGLLVKAYCGPGDEVLYPAHGFLMYSIYARGVGAVPVAAPETDLRCDVDALLAAVTPRTRVVFVANPNNPTGTYLTAEEMARLRDGLPGKVILAIDGAYGEYVDRNDYTDGRPLVDATPNTVMLRTFSKIFGLGGCRVGWGYFPPAIADVLNRLRSPFNVAAPSQAAARAAVEDGAFLALCKAHNDHWLPWMIDQARGLGLAATDSVGNFALIGFPAEGPRTARAADTVLRAKGIIVRRVEGYGLPDWLRVSVGLDEENRAVIAALAEFMGN